MTEFHPTRGQRQTRGGREAPAHGAGRALPVPQAAQAELEENAQ